MSGGVRTLLRRQYDRGLVQCSEGLKAVRHRGLGAIQFWVIALLIGIAAGFAAVGFRLGITYLQQLIYGANDVTLASRLAGLHWGWVLTVPIIGGLVVGVILDRFTPDGRARSVAHVIEGAALTEGRVDTRYGLASSLASLITLSTGGSTGREGPVVHLAAVMSSYVAKWIHADGVTGRDLLGCAVAAAVSASFNAPIAGALFALEVILRHFAVHAFAPIVIASVAGAVVSRIFVGDVTEFMLPVETLAFYVELPAFMLLGLLSGLVAALMMWTIFAAEDLGDAVQGSLGLPRWLRPGIAGALLGGIAIFFPHIIGVGYETTSRALTEGLFLWEAVVFAVIKVVAVAITMAGRMGGGVFSPSLMLGALTGLAFGLLATSVFPAVSGTSGLYAIAGMGAVAAAVLGAPISTSLIVFEMTGDWQAGLAVMVAVSLSTALASRLVARSFFLTQIERRGVHMAAGPQAYLMATIPVSRLMKPLSDEAGVSLNQVQALLEQGSWLHPTDTLETALPLFDQLSLGYLPVARPSQGDGPPDLIGTIDHIDALKAYNRALAATAREEHS
ncbi:MAG: chloride channel protein [Pseudomonadota bacterium]